jgi:NTE family protein
MMALPKYLKQIKSTIDHEYKRSLYRNLVFKGGGVRGIAYMGALEVLDEYRIVDNIERVAGTSAGAIGATLLSFRLSIPETKELFNSLDFSKIPQSATKTRRFKVPRFAEEESYRRFITKYGWYSSEYLYQWLEFVIADQFDGDGRATFADFQDRGFRDLYIIAANISRQRPEIFSTTHTPDVSVADAVRMSMSIPIFFESLRFDGKSFGDGDYYVDGGLFDNFPMHIFDSSDFSGRTWSFRDGINWETLGLFLYPDRYLHPSDPEIPTNVWEYLMLAFRNLYQSYELTYYETSTVDQHRTIEISDRGIATTDFDISLEGEKYNLLYESGKAAVRNFFSDSD